ncbi:MULTISPECIES: DUF2163 domain-containing protein [Enterobacter cloacae complex]|nr:DUF2163 domain-containing protein [Enterobacter kobei]EFO2889191.1 DUF2163 domain-containing protein [Escherichia coli]ELJ8185715.1 DUF2163 domain-containing protein [Escherichia coli]MCA7039803.1 DUF2163 domain-containing protein [Escherichia coli]MCM7803052.1 DUF2163 domain-containing protein [Enterobacter kobei]HAW7811587.1 DUF2163 domain-containing protein [Escherichia coli]
MNASTYTNANLLKYWKLVRGTTKTQLSLMDIMSLGVFVTCFDVLPKGTNGFHWTDSLIDIPLDGYQYTSFPDIISGSLPSYSEQKGITNDAINFKISNVNASVRALALGGFLKDAQMNIKLVILNPYDSTVIDSMLMFTGFIDYIQAVADPNAKTNEMTVYVNSVYKKLDRQPALIAANSVYQSYYKGDEYFSLLGQVNQNQNWKYK